MWDAIISYLSENYPNLIVFIIGGGILIWVTIKATRHYDRLIKTEDAIKAMPCQAHKDEIKEIKGYFTLLGDIKESVRKVEEYIIKTDPSSLNSLVRKCSPYKLTTFGDKLLEESGGNKCLATNSAAFIEEIENLKPLVALDVEKYALSVLNDNLKKEYFNEVKNYIYQIPDPAKITDSNGETLELSIKLEMVLLVMSIRLRDLYFEKHSDIDTSAFFLSPANSVD